MTSRVAHFLTVTATVTPRTVEGETDRYNTPALVAGEPFEAASWWHPLDSEEQTDRPAGTVTLRAYFDAGDAISTLDRIAFTDGPTGEVAGPPQKWRHPVTGDEFQTVELVEVIVGDGGS